MQKSQLVIVKNFWLSLLNSEFASTAKALELKVKISKLITRNIIDFFLIFLPFFT